MEIKILHNPDWKSGKYFSSDSLIEKIKTKSEYENIAQVKYDILKADSSEKYEILPNIEKFDIGEIKHITKDSDYLYFVNIFENEGQGVVALLRYNLTTLETESVYSFEEDISSINRTKRFKIFIINDNYLIIQSEYLVTNMANTYSGYFEFSQKLINMKDFSVMDILDENFINNGISYLIPISENQCVVKTGYDMLTDNRYNSLEKEEASLESIGFLNVGQMVSDMVLDTKNINVDIIEQAYFTKTIPYVKIQDNYLIYTVVDNELKQEEIKFYNLDTAEIKSCINQQVIIESDLANPVVINQEPYMCLKRKGEISFLNINTNKVDYKNSTDMHLSRILKDTIIYSGVRKQLLTKKVKPFFEIHSFPNGQVLLHDEHEYLDSVEVENDVIYVVVK